MGKFLDAAGKIATAPLEAERLARMGRVLARWDLGAKAKMPDDDT